MNEKKRFCPSQIKILTKRIVKRKENIVVEKDTEELLEKLKHSVANKKKFKEKKMSSSVSRILVYDVLSRMSKDEITK